VEILQFHVLRSYLPVPCTELNSQVKAKVKVTLRLKFSQSVSQSVSTVLFSWGRFCLLHMMLAPDSAVFLGSESLGTRDHILLSQTPDFPFRCLLRLAGSRWRYSAPPSHGFASGAHDAHDQILGLYSLGTDRIETVSSPYCCEGVFTKLLPSNGRRTDCTENQLLVR
jgi:hypothetical protein